MKKKKEEMKKGKPKKTRKVRAKVTVGKNPAEKMKGKRKDREQKLEEEIELDYKEEMSEEEEEMNLKEKEEKKAEDAKKWNWLLPNSSSLYCFFVFSLTLFSNNVQDSDLFGLTQSEEMSSRFFSTRRVRVSAASTQLP